jgi:hypothetical protein
LVGAFGASKARRSIQSLIRPPRASPSDARDALSSSLRDDEQAALDAFLASGGDDAKAKALMVEAATTKVGEGRGRERGKEKKPTTDAFRVFSSSFCRSFGLALLCVRPQLWESKRNFALAFVWIQVFRERGEH